MQCLKLVDWWLSETAERFTVDSHFLVKLELGWQKGKNNIWHPRPADKYLYHYITTPEKLSNTCQNTDNRCFDNYLELKFTFLHV